MLYNCFLFFSPSEVKQPLYLLIYLRSQQLPLDFSCEVKPALGFLYYLSGLRIARAQTIA
jgi:hypothetical protein